MSYYGKRAFDEAPNDCPVCGKRWVYYTGATFDNNTDFHPQAYYVTQCVCEGCGHEWFYAGNDFLGYLLLRRHPDRGLSKDLAWLVPAKGYKGYQKDISLTPDEKIKSSLNTFREDALTYLKETMYV